MRVRKCCGHMGFGYLGYLVQLLFIVVIFPTLSMASSYTEVLSPEAKEQAQLALMHQIYSVLWQMEID